MQIWVDADACPGPIKTILFKAAARVRTNTLFISNQPLRIPVSPFLKFIQVSGGLDVADTFIIENMSEGDLVITADIPLAAKVVKKGGTALNPRGQLYTAENIGYFLSLRNFMDGLRSSGLNTSGTARLSKKDRENFANQLDRYLRTHLQ